MANKSNKKQNERICLFFWWEFCVPFFLFVFLFYFIIRTSINHKHPTVLSSKPLAKTFSFIEAYTISIENKSRDSFHMFSVYVTFHMEISMVC